MYRCVVFLYKRVSGMVGNENEDKKHRVGCDKIYSIFDRLYTVKQ